ncbi:hypothetical protein PILCRDRAFT_309289 [Piloderma croceum F 1598]|uniref:Uncharacterized protein n=1 Tax=Piloderma croceum (strain F 1598) TaxID=765440 RepID=A0A0C3G481_PILCF|nr:hypothetical protein PILCRDRAFT_309289 [Piloderma croceum F 1598]
MSTYRLCLRAKQKMHLTKALSAIPAGPLKLTPCEVTRCHSRIWIFDFCCQLS